MPVATSSRTIPEILSSLLAQFTMLVRKEGELARTEMAEKVGQVAAGLVLVMLGAVLLIPALVVLLGAAVAAIEQAGIGPPYSALIVGGAVLIIGLILLMIGVSRFKADNLMPRKTMHQLQEDASVAKQVRPDHDYKRAA